MADLYNPLAGVRGTGRTYNDLLASRPGTRDAFAQQLMQMLQGLKPTTYTYRGANPDGNSVEPEVDLTGYRADILDQLFGGADKGGYTLNLISEAQPSDGYTFSTGQLRDPYQSNNHVGRWYGRIDANGNLTGLRWKNDSTTRSLVDRIGNFATDWGPALVLAAATAGAGGFAGLGGGASAAPAAQGASLGQELAREIAYGAIGEAPAFGYSELMYGAAGAAGGAAASDIASAAGQPELGLAPQTAGAESAAGAAPISASTPSTVASPFKMALDAVKPYASLIGPATSLLSAGQQMPQMPQMPQNADARIPGVEAPPEARGYQPASAPILDVLGRNRRENRNRTLLTGPGGVSMESVRVGGNTLLGA